jgi:hypothetical protein
MRLAAYLVSRTMRNWYASCCDSRVECVFRRGKGRLSFLPLRNFQLKYNTSAQSLLFVSFRRKPSFLFTRRCAYERTLVDPGEEIGQSVVRFMPIHKHLLNGYCLSGIVRCCMQKL